jgi:hypothetical protein
MHLDQVGVPVGKTRRTSGHVPCWPLGLGECPRDERPGYQLGQPSPSCRSPRGPGQPGSQAEVKAVKFGDMVFIHPFTAISSYQWHGS